VLDLLRAGSINPGSLYAMGRLLNSSLARFKTYKSSGGTLSYLGFLRGASPLRPVLTGSPGVYCPGFSLNSLLQTTSRFLLSCSSYNWKGRDPISAEGFSGPRTANIEGQPPLNTANVALDNISTVVFKEQ